MEKIDIMWKDAFNAQNLGYRVVRILDSKPAFCLYLLDNGNEVRMICGNSSVYDFSKEKLMNRDFKHIAKVIDCFKFDFVENAANHYSIYCIITERLDRDFAKYAEIQAGINLFVEAWQEYLQCSDTQVYNMLEEAYINNDEQGNDYVHRYIISNAKENIDEKVALVFAEVYKTVKDLSPTARINLFPANVGVADSEVKICFIG